MDKIRKISIPLYMPTSFKIKKNNFATLNLNDYRNWHYQTSNKIKKQFKENLRKDLAWKTVKTPYWLAMTLYYKRISDMDNWESVITKFFNDALVEYWCVPDDNVKYYIEKHCVVGGRDKENPRIDIEII